MHYQNRQPKEGANVSKVSPVKQLLVMGGSALILALVLFVMLSFLGGWAVRLVPFSSEVKLVEKLDLDFNELLGNDANDSGFIEREAALTQLATRVIAHMDIPEGMDITVHYSDEPVFNAFATLGGHVFFFRGLIAQMPHENALAMVMAHEIAHELHRDPISGLGAGVAATVALSAILGSGSAGNLLDVSSLLGTASFTRLMETRADKTAIEAVNGLYGHVAGADALFKIIAAEKNDDSNLPDWAETFLRTHPLDADRIQSIEQQAADNGWRVEGETTPLVKALAQLSLEHESTD